MTLRYDFHGVTFDVWTDDKGVTDAIAERFTGFATTDPRPAEINFTIELVDNPSGHTVSRPQGRSRPSTTHRKARSRISTTRKSSTSPCRRPFG